MDIRLARTEDLSAVGAGCLAMLKESPWYLADQPMDVIGRVRYLRERLERDPTWRLFVADDDGVLAGFIGVELTGHPLHPQPFSVVRDWAHWVHPKYKHQKVMWKLMELVKAWGRERKAQGILYGKSLRSDRPKRGPVEQLVWIDLER